MATPARGPARPKMLNSLTDLSRELDSAAVMVPPAPTVKLVDLPDSCKLQPAADKPWWVDTPAQKPEAPAAVAPSASEPPLIDVDLVAQPGRKPALLDWRLIGGTAAAMLVVAAVMVFTAWAATSRAPAVAQQPAPAVVIVPGDPLLTQPTPQAPVAAPADLAAGEDRTAAAEREFQEKMALLEKSLKIVEEERDRLAARPPQPAPAPVAAAPKQGCYGTAVDFADSPAEAAELATEKRKLMLVLTISGNFEESKFT